MDTQTLKQLYINDLIGMHDFKHNLVSLNNAHHITKHAIDNQDAALLDLAGEWLIEIGARLKLRAKVNKAYALDNPNQLVNFEGFL